MAMAPFPSETKRRTLDLPPSQQRPFPLSPPPPSPSSFNLDSKVSPSILLIIIILAIIFFISGLLHLLVRFLLRPETRDPDDVLDNVTALQGQLQQLFNLHDHGVDQAFIDALPVFNYKAIIGVRKNPFDCAVCLCEFDQEDKLRLLPKCSHAFHMECIDTWLLSHSTCPLCRFNLISDFSPNNSCSPIVLVLESGSENSSREIERANSTIGSCQRDEFGSTHVATSTKLSENEARDEEIGEKVVPLEEKVVTVKLGKYRNVDGGGEGSSESNVDERRCFSMGSFAYVVDENTSLQVPIRTPLKKPSSIKKSSLPLTPGHRSAMSECGCGSIGEFPGFEPFKTSFENRLVTSGGNIGSSSNSSLGNKRESFTASKIWMRAKKERANTSEGSSRRAFSFRFPLRSDGEGLKGGHGEIGNRGTNSEIDFGRWGGNEIGFDEESQSGNSFDTYSQASAPSFARRTLLWLAGRQNKVVHSSNFPPNL